MNANAIRVGWGLALICCLPGRSWAETPTPDEKRHLEGEVRTILRAKCASCHGPDVPNPRAGFGYVLDLGRVAGNPAMIVPSRPDESELWAMVRGEEMPPPDSPTGPLTTAEKESIRAWIAAGAPVAPPPTPEADDRPPPRTAVDRSIRWLGKFHLLLLHFPIALTVVAGGCEAWAAWKGSREAGRMARFCLWLAACAVIPTVALGWLLALGGTGAGSPNLLFLHRWLGTAAGVWMIGSAVVVVRTARRGWPTWYGRAMIFACVILVAGVAHLGGLLAHGERFFDW